MKVGVTLLKKLKKDDYNWTGKYIREYNEMVSYYEKQLEELLKEKSVPLSLHTEQEEYSQLLKAQICYLDSIGYGDGSASYMAYSQLSEEMFQMRFTGILDLYFALQVKKYKPDKVYNC